MGWQRVFPPASALLAMMLTACVTSYDLQQAAPKLDLPPVPAGLKICFDKAPAPAPPGNLSRAQVFAILADLKASDQAKTDCGRRLIAWFEDLARGFKQ